MADFSARLHEKRVFSKLDLKKGYYQVPMGKDDISKTAVITPFGLFEFLRMPFGLRNAGQTFQRMMDQVLNGLDFCFVYLDDVLVASENKEQHICDLREVMDRFTKQGLTLNLEKCKFGRPEVEFLGHRVSTSGAVPLTKHTETIQSFHQPEDKKQLQRFLGMINFYRRFIPRAAQMLLPLTNALCGSGTKILWTAEMDKSFAKAKEAICTATCLVHPDPAADQLGC
jgi:hypothetical protein